jgi:purine-cytosine permease-like protein
MAADIPPGDPVTPHHLPPGHSGARQWLTRALASVGAAVALVVSFFLGALVFVTALGLMLLVMIGVIIRIWWLRRQFRAAFERQASQGGAEGPHDVIEGEYEVVDKRKRRERR